jgi:RNA polymerase sigma-70 factor (ECF subfamily)
MDLMAVTVDPDAALMLRVKHGDREAFAELVDRYKQPIMNLIFRTVRDAAEAEDLTQKVFLQVYRSADRYRVSARFSTWIYTIARNLCLNELRRRARHPAESLDESWSDEDPHPWRQATESGAPSPDGALLRRELEERVDQALNELPETQRTALLLCRQEDVSYEEMSRILGCSLSATKSLIHRARETLRQKLKPYLRTGAAWQEADPP